MQHWGVKASTALPGEPDSEITKQEPFAAGQTFATVGAYEKVVGRFRGELDPKSPKLGLLGWPLAHFGFSGCNFWRGLSALS